MKRTFFLMLALLLSTSVRADLFVVVNAANPVRNLTTDEVTNLYLARSRTFPTGEYALVFDLPRDHPVRSAFFRTVAQMDLRQVNAYWSRLMFSGQEMPPQALPNEQAVVDVIRRNPSALGYLSSAPAGAGLKVVLHLKE